MRQLALSSAALLAVACSTASPPPASTAPSPVEVKSTGTPGQAAAVRTARLSAQVKAVDQAARTLTIVEKGGKTETVKVPPEVKRFEEIAAGDLIQLEVQQGLMLEYQPVGTESVAPTAAIVGGRADASSAPGGAVAAGVQTTVTVTAVDTGSRMVTFQDTYGERYQVKAGPGLSVEKLKVGDRLLATYVETVALTVEKAPAK
jgi:hypothetical protein